MPDAATMAVIACPLGNRSSLCAAGEPCKIVPMTPARHAQWDAFVVQHGEGTIFHTLAWHHTVKETFGHEAIYLMALRHGSVVGVLPMFFVPSRLAGRLLVSVPYAVGGGIIAKDDRAAAALFDEARRLACDRRCRVVDLRSERAVIPSLPIVDRYVGFRRPLPDDPNEVMGWLPRKARAAARNARTRHRLEVSFGDEHLRQAWELYAVSMRRLASLTYPYTLFERLAALTPNRHWTCLIRWQGRAVAGLFTLLFNHRVMPYFFGATDEARQCHAANFCYLSVMERGVAEGFRVFDFGRSRRDNAGCCDFKRFHGFEPFGLEYQCYLPPGQLAPELSPADRRFRVVRRLWPYLPLGVSRMLGARLARHIPG